MTKNRIFLKLSLSSLLLAGMLGACKDEFLEIDPAGVYTLESLTNKKGVEGMLIAAYAALDGRPETQTTGSTNWVWGSVAADDANKGTEPNDFSSINPIELYQQTPTGEMGAKWRGVVDGIGMANQVLRSMKEATDIPAADAPGGGLCWRSTCRVA